MGTSFKSFKRLQQAGQLYVDKSGFIADLLQDLYGSAGGPGYPAALLLRPHGFGKSTLLDMLHAFFSLEEDSRELFAKLNIASRPQLCSAWQQRFPVLHLNFSSVSGAGFKAWQRSFGEALRQELICHHLYLLDSQRLKPWQLRYLRQLRENELEEPLLADFMGEMLSALGAHWQTAPIVLIDDYEAPLVQALCHGYIKQAIAFCRSFYQPLAENSGEFKFALLTAEQGLFKEQVFFKTGYIECWPAAGRRFGNCCGFSLAEVRALMESLPQLRQESAEDLRRLCGGWCLAGVPDLYRAQGVISYLNAAPQAEAEPDYELLSQSGQMLLAYFLRRGGHLPAYEAERLLAGKSIRTFYEEEISLAADRPVSDLVLWNLLYACGILTSLNSDLHSGSSIELTLPNQSARRCLVKLLTMLKAAA